MSSNLGGHFSKLTKVHTFLRKIKMKIKKKKKEEKHVYKKIMIPTPRDTIPEKKNQ